MLGNYPKLTSIQIAADALTENFSKGNNGMIAGKRVEYRNTGIVISQVSLASKILTSSMHEESNLSFGVQPILLDAKGSIGGIQVM